MFVAGLNGIRGGVSGAPRTYFEGLRISAGSVLPFPGSPSRSCISDQKTWATEGHG